MGSYIRISLSPIFLINTRHNREGSRGRRGPFLVIKFSLVVLVVGGVGGGSMTPIPSQTPTRNYENQYFYETSSEFDLYFFLSSRKKISTIARKCFAIDLQRLRIPLSQKAFYYTGLGM